MRGTPTIFFQSLNRAFNIFGVDRQLFFLCVGLCLPIAFSARLAFYMDAVAALVFIFLYSAALLITRLDNQMLAIYRRHIRYRKYYAAIAGIHAAITSPKASVPICQGQRGLM